jgi:hypothetical protein
MYIAILNNVSVHYGYFAENITQRIYMLNHFLFYLGEKIIHIRPLSDQAASQPAPGHSQS